MEISVYAYASFFAAICAFVTAAILQIRKIGFKNLFPPKPVKWTRERESELAKEVARQVLMRDRN